MCVFCYTIAWGRGDPHFTTIDGRTYTFNGLGEYVLLRENHSDFEFQGRTELAFNSNATIFSAFAIKDGIDVVEVSTIWKLKMLTYVLVKYNHLQTIEDLARNNIIIIICT